ncbi:hypothetical protein PHAMO_270234 [Magnetospirillum molischianum DSM 120]|uniref:Uncharacterized protein n=1 Tax=Magnetospirillum molischianum DSM 120 TaxID=1150626 RepID=H8FSQ5_MAGML|nr:hypothetical protein PHAMO_270234 [Magnetospirillum molischianum DSM 120]
MVAGQDLRQLSEAAQDFHWKRINIRPFAPPLAGGDGCAVVCRVQLCHSVIPGGVRLFISHRPMRSAWSRVLPGWRQIS